MKTLKVAIAILMLFITLGCEKKQNNLTIGADLPLTGKEDYYGKSALKGIEVALDELNNSKEFSNAKINLITQDNLGKSDQAKLAFDNLIKDDVLAVIGGGTSAESKAMAPVANHNKLVMISPISSATTLTDAGPYFFRTCPKDFDQAVQLADWVTETKLNKIAVIYVNSTWGTGFKNDFVAHFKANSCNILGIESSENGDVDFRAQLSVIKKLNPDALVFIVYAKEGGSLVRQARELGLNQPIYGADPWSQPDFRTGAGLYTENVRYTTPIQFDGESFNKFKDAYKKKFNEEPDVYSSNGYDCMMILAKAYTDGIRNSNQLRDYLLQMDGYLGATGLTKFDKNGSVIGKKFGKFEIRNGQPFLLK